MPELSTEEKERIGSRMMLMWHPTDADLEAAGTTRTDAINGIKNGAYTD